MDDLPCTVFNDSSALGLCLDLEVEVVNGVSGDLVLAIDLGGAETSL